jgi:hypothetical protein
MGFSSVQFPQPAAYYSLQNASMFDVSSLGRCLIRPAGQNAMAGRLLREINLLDRRHAYPQGHSREF